MTDKCEANANDGPAKFTDAPTTAASLEFPLASPQTRCISAILSFVKQFMTGSTCVCVKLKKLNVRKS